VANTKSAEKQNRQAIRHRARNQAITPALRTAALKADSRLGESASDMVLESLEEHHVVKWTLAELEKMTPEDERFDAKVTVLMESVRHHVEEEQEDLFVKARKLLGEKVLEELGERMAKAKKLAPTRPHPRAPDTGAAACPTAPCRSASRPRLGAASRPCRG